jgi:hypothetical protein
MKILKSILYFFQLKDGIMDSEESYIKAHNPKSISDIEHLSREYARLKHPTRRSFGY